MYFLDGLQQSTLNLSTVERESGKNLLMAIITSVGGLMLLAGCVNADEKCLREIDAGRFESALGLCMSALHQSPSEKALTLTIRAAGSLGDYRTIDRLLKPASEYPVSGDAFYEAGAFARAQHHSMRAHEYFKQSIDLYRADGDPEDLARALVQQAAIASNQSQYSDALTLASEAFDVSSAAGFAQIEAHALSVLFNVFQITGNYDLAISTLEQIVQRQDPAQESTIILSAFRKGVIELDRYNFGLAASEFNIALEAANGNSNRAILRGLHLNMVEASLGLNRIDEAVGHLKEAWSYAEPDGKNRFALHFYEGRISQEQGNHDKAKNSFDLALKDSGVSHSWLWEIHFYAGQSAVALGKQEAAYPSFLASAKELENTSLKLAYDSLRGQLLTQQRSVYESLFLSVLELKSTDEAFDIVERSKARTFVDAYISNADEASVGESDINLTVTRRINGIQSYMAALKASPVTDVKPVRDIANKTQDSVVLVHFSAGGQFWVGSISNGKSSLHRTTNNNEELSTLLDRYANNPNDNDVLEKLGRILLPPQLLPDPEKHLFIVPDLQTEHVALAGLRVRDQFFIERHSFSLIPNASFLVTLPLEGHDKRASTAPIVLGDPLGDLPAAMLEAHFVAKIIESNELVGSRATLDALLQGRHSTVLHVASHSGIDSLGPWLQLANNKIYADNLLQYKLAPDIAVLASCISAAAVEKNIWGSLGAVFLATGSSAVLATLWSVEDHATSIILENFYRAYRDEQTPSQALASAQKAAINSGLTPDSWAPFVILGERSSFGKSYTGDL